MEGLSKAKRHSHSQSHISHTPVADAQYHNGNQHQDDEQHKGREEGQAVVWL